MQFFFCEFLGIFQSIMERLRTAAFFIILINVFIDKKPREIQSSTNTSVYFPEYKHQKEQQLWERVFLLLLRNSCKSHISDET